MKYMTNIAKFAFGAAIGLLMTYALTPLFRGHLFDPMADPILTFLVIIGCGASVFIKWGDDANEPIGHALTLRIATPKGWYAAQVDDNLNVATLIHAIANQMKMDMNDKLELYVDGNKLNEDAKLSDCNMNGRIALCAVGGAV